MNNKYQNQRRIHRQTAAQAGFASIMIALIIVLVMGLIAVGFAQVTRNEQQQAFNSQLAAQAYYAAESGINDVANLVNNHKFDPPAPTPGPGCISLNTYDSSAFPPGTTQTINPTTGASYTCVMLDLTPHHLSKTISAGTGWSFIANSSTSLSSLNFEWTSPNGNNAFPGNYTSTSLKPGGPGNWGSKMAVLQVQITPLSGVMTRNSLITSTAADYMFPANGNNNNSVNYTSIIGKATVSNGKCTTVSPYTCNSTINTLGGASEYLVHVFTYYDDAVVTVTGTDGSGNPVGFVGSQYQVDVTGKARDVLKRLEVTIPYSKSGNDDFNMAIDARNICKRFAAQPGTINYYGLDGNPAAASGDACGLPDPTSLPP